MHTFFSPALQNYAPSPQIPFAQLKCRTIASHLFVHRHDFCSAGVELFAPSKSRRISGHVAALAVGECSSSSGEATVKRFDIATLGNLCVDIVLNVPELPPPARDARIAYAAALSAQPPDKKFWEAGGNCNIAIAAARIGLQCAAIGHVGDEIYGKFLLDVLRHEGIDMMWMMNPNKINDYNSKISNYETLLCWVLVDPLRRHGFCSVADFSDEPAFNWIESLSEETKMAIRESKILFCNGYGFDELSTTVLVSALQYASGVGTSIFFDPGPRGKSLFHGSVEEQRALNCFLKMSDVLLLTFDEAESLTGIGNPILAGQELLRRGVRTKWVIIKVGSRGSILINMSGIFCASGFKVNVIDTVGCGDSFVAAIAYGFIHKLPNVQTLAIANAVGAATAMGCGAGRNVASLKGVTEILRASNLREDDEFWKELVKSVECEDITFLTKNAINGSNSHFNLVSMEEVVTQLLPQLESVSLQMKPT